MKVLVRASAKTTSTVSSLGLPRTTLAPPPEMVARIRDRINLLKLDALAHMGRPGFVVGTRELVEYPYIIVYTVDDERREIAVLTIVHGAQDREG